MREDADPDPRTSPDDLPRELAARYRPERLLGAGGMGAVHLAIDLTSGRRVALKRMIGEPDLSRIARFVREAEAMRRIRHPHVVRCLDHGLCEDLPYLVMEYLEGESLESFPVREDPLPPLLAVASGLEALHDAGLLHRDVKPANVVLTRDGRAVLVDLGLARIPDMAALTRTGAVVGTLGYMAPELLRGGRYSSASDWFAWGVTLYALLERRLPYSTAAVLTCVSGGRLPLLRFRKVPAADPRRRLILRLLAANPAERPNSGAEIRALLDEVAEHENQATARLEVPTGIPGPGAKSASRPIPERGNRGRWVPALLGGSAVAAAVGLGWWGGTAPVGSVPVDGEERRSLSAPPGESAVREPLPTPGEAALGAALARALEATGLDHGQRGFPHDRRALRDSAESGDPAMAWLQLTDALRAWLPGVGSDPGPRGRRLLARAWSLAHRTEKVLDVLELSMALEGRQRVVDAVASLRTVNRELRAALAPDASSPVAVQILALGFGHDPSIEEVEALDLSPANPLRDLLFQALAGWVDRDIADYVSDPARAALRTLGERAMNRDAAPDPPGDVRRIGEVSNLVTRMLVHLRGADRAPVRELGVRLTAEVARRVPEAPGPELAGRLLRVLDYVLDKHAGYRAMTRPEKQAARAHAERFAARCEEVRERLEARSWTSP